VFSGTAVKRGEGVASPPALLPLTVLAEFVAHLHLLESGLLAFELSNDLQAPTLSAVFWDLLAVGGVSVDVPPSAYTIVGPIALKINTVMMTKE